MDVARLCRREVITVRESEDIAAAARLMRQKHVGYLVVVEPDFAGSTFRPVGVLTDRDIVIKIVAQDINPRKAQVSEAMSRNPVTIAISESLVSAAQEMRRIGVRRIPVVGELGELRGVLSLDDVLNVLSNELQNLAGAIRNEQSFESAMRV
jgi:CBS domain-containing protein